MKNYKKWKNCRLKKNWFLCNTFIRYSRVAQIFHFNGPQIVQIIKMWQNFAPKTCNVYYSIFNLDDLIFISKSDRHQIQIVVVENFESSLMFSVWLLWFFWNFTIWQFSWSFLWYLILCGMVNKLIILIEVLAIAIGNCSVSLESLPMLQFRLHVEFCLEMI